MQKLLLPITILAIIIAIWEQSQAEKNVYIMVICIFVSMYGMMKLSAKIPSKNKENDD